VHYMGSKARHADEIIRVAAAGRRPEQAWVEPFVGGGNVICRVPGEAGPRLGADKNPYMIALLDAVGNRGWLPPETMAEEEWREIKKSPDRFPSELVAFAATGPTFGSIWFGPWAKNDDYCSDRYGQSREAVIRDIPGLRGCKFVVSEYDKLKIPPESVIYCDPPYANTSDYKQASRHKGRIDNKIAVGDSLSQNSWDRLKFWRWADVQIDNGHRIFVSEYAGPPASTYKVIDPALRDEAQAIVTAGKILYERDQSPSNRPTPEERDALVRRKAELAKREQADRQRQADRWHVVWSKEVTSDFSSVREAGVKAGKRETELLLTRD
jgi:DNA adenine methylase